MQKTGVPVPDRYAAMLAEHAKPRARVAAFSAPPSDGGIASPVMSPTPKTKMVEGSIRLASGAVKIPAKTASGYCLKASADYIGTGDENYPAITGAMPRCLDDSGRVAEHKDSAFRRY
jgi:hypothetical protein